ncbi:hypothetical protein HDU83_003491 [Entophlyctis luteolus]|nr:hypothetical protein HDU83_003491 [Entophlyctis luteolus]
MPASIPQQQAAPTFSAQDRIARRLHNTRGTLGTRVNLDGTLRTNPTVTSAPQSHQQAHSAPPTSRTNPGDFPDLIYFGGHDRRAAEAATRGPSRRGMGLAAAIYSDLERNLEKKKATQREMAEFEKAQLKERAEMKREAAVKKMTEDRASGRIPGAYCAQTAEKADRKKQTLKYAAELSGQIAEIKAFKQASGEENKLVKPIIGRNSFNLMKESTKRVGSNRPVTLTIIFSISSTTPGNLSFPTVQRGVIRFPNAKKAHAHLTAQVTLFPILPNLDESKQGDEVSNSLPMKNRAKIADARRQKTDVVQRIEPGPTNRLHDPAKDDPNEPAYFHFGRPGNGAPILDAATRSTVDAK